MKQYRRAHDSQALTALALVAILYVAVLAGVPTLSGRRTVDGILSVLLGLYVCSHPAPNAVDVLFFHRHALREAVSDSSGLVWLALNGLDLLLGWVVLFLGTSRLVGEVR